VRNVEVPSGRRDVPPRLSHKNALPEFRNTFQPRSEDIKPDTPLFWSTFGRRHRGTVRRPTEGRTSGGSAKTYGRLIGYPMLKPHDLRHGVAMEVYDQHSDLEQVRGLLGHMRIETTQLYADPAGRAQNKQSSFTSRRRSTC
jgi:site-specific recombinase XerC